MGEKTLVSLHQSTYPVADPLQIILVLLQFCIGSINGRLIAFRPPMTRISGGAGEQNCHHPNKVSAAIPDGLHACARLLASNSKTEE